MYIYIYIYNIGPALAPVKLAQNISGQQLEILFQINGTLICIADLSGCDSSVWTI